MKRPLLPLRKVPAEMPLFRIGILLFLLSAPVLHAQRIVSLSPAVTETLFFLGAGPKLVGRSTVCNWPPEVKKIPPAGDFGTVFAETLIRLKPDIVLTSGFSPSSAELIRKTEIPYEVLKVRTADDYLAMVRRIGEVAGCREAADREVQRAEKELAHFRALPAQNRPSVLWVIWHDPVMAAGEGSFPDMLLNLAGGKNTASGIRREYFRCSEEWLLACNPDFVIWTVHGVPVPGTGIFAKMRAVREGRCLFPPEDTVLRPGPRMFSAVHFLEKAFRRKTGK